MKKIKYIILILILSILLVFMIKGCTGHIVDEIADIFELNSDNYNTIINKSISPDKEHVAYYFSRDLGATTSENYQLSIYAFGTDLDNKIGNIFASSKPFSFEWINSNEILIIYKNSSESYKKANEYDGIKIKSNEKS